IVGIADDVRHEGAHKPPPPVVYYPLEAIEGAPLWGPRTSLVVLIRTAGLDPVQLTSSIRELAREIEPAAALAEVRTMPQVIAHSMARTTFTMMLLGVAGLMALILSIVGLYGVVAYTVSRRHTEIGVRMALGANASRVGGMIVLESLRVAAAGVVLGLIGAAFATGALRSLLFGVEPTDGLTLMTVALLLLVVTAVASFIPARRAARLDPLESLRG
ncbi:MAG: FtsX-like permease family protein, partial [Longimicrobiales bacterium]